jgi:hypothetical protein
MNKEMLTRSKGQTVRLQPSAVGARGELLDEEWVISDVSEDVVTLQHLQTGHHARLGCDSIYSYQVDAHGQQSPTEKRGFLMIRMRIVVGAQGISVTPFLPPGITVTNPSPLDAEISRIAKQEYDLLWPVAKGAVRALLIAGDMTDQQMLNHLLSQGEPYDPGTLDRLYRMTTPLVHRAQPDQTREAILLGYRGTYTINPQFGAALEQNVASDPQPPRR